MNTEEIKEIAEAFAYVLNNINQNVTFGHASTGENTAYIRIREQINKDPVVIQGKTTTINNLIEKIIYS